MMGIGMVVAIIPIPFVSGIAGRRSRRSAIPVGKSVSRESWSEEGIHMFQKTDFWIGLAVGAVAGIFGYRFMQEREQQLAALQPAAPTAELPLAELQRQKEELEDLIAAQEAKK